MRYKSIIILAYEDINMHKSHKAIPFTITTHHDEVINNNEPWENHPAYDTTIKRQDFVLWMSIQVKCLMTLKDMDSPKSICWILL